METNCIHRIIQVTESATKAPPPKTMLKVTRRAAMVGRKVSLAKQAPSAIPMATAAISCRTSARKKTKKWFTPLLNPIYRLIYT